jgi:hypothetical protein
VRLHDLPHDGETQAHTGSFDAPAPSKSFKCPLLLVDRNPGTVIGNIHATAREHLHRHLFARRRMGNGIFDKVSDRVLDRVSVFPERRPAFHRHDGQRMTEQPKMLVTQVDAVGFHHLSPCLSQNAPLAMDKSSVKLSHPAQRRLQEIAPTPAFLRYHNGCVPPEGLQRDE